MIAFFTLAAVVAAAFTYTQVQSRRIEARFPPIGDFTDVGGYELHSVHVPAPAGELPPIVFLHGASGNLRDQMAAFAEPLKGRAEMLFVDRPGHGYSERGPETNAYPDGQAAAIAQLMEAKGIERAIISAHSFGSAIAASFALAFPEKTAGLLFLAPATHPWPGGVAWYYGVAKSSLTGPAFVNLVALPAGLRRVPTGTRCVFAPNPMPERYAEETGPSLVLRPRAFRANSTDVANLKAYVARTAPRYNEISAPTIIITGNRDGVVLPEIHSKGLARDIEGAELVWIDNLGHKPDYVANDLAIAALEKIAGINRDLQSMARALEKSIADDGVEC